MPISRGNAFFTKNLGQSFYRSSNKDSFYCWNKCSCCKGYSCCWESNLVLDNLLYEVFSQYLYNLKLSSIKHVSKRFMYTQLPALYFEHVMGLETLGMLLWRLVKNSACWPDCSYQVTIKEIKICCKGLASFQWYLMTALGVFRPVC